jgi:hypothetical protein
MWRKAKVIALLKLGMNPDQSSSYHPVSLLSAADDTVNMAYY